MYHGNVIIWQCKKSAFSWKLIQWIFCNQSPKMKVCINSTSDGRIRVYVAPIKFSFPWMFSKYPLPPNEIYVLYRTSASLRYIHEMISAWSVLWMLIVGRALSACDVGLTHAPAFKMYFTSGSFIDRSLDLNNNSSKWNFFNESLLQSAGSGFVTSTLIYTDRHLPGYPHLHFLRDIRIHSWCLS
jgi:hypothetical protein